MLKKIIASITLLAAATTHSLPVQAGPVDDVIGTHAPVTTQMRYSWWNSLTPRQQQLERAIAQVTWNYYQQTGTGVYPNRENLMALMQWIGASANEAPWVYQRMTHHHNTIQYKGRSNQTVINHNNLLNCLNAGGGLTCMR
jgi:hypothetical protein